METSSEGSVGVEVRAFAPDSNTATHDVTMASSARLQLNARGDAMKGKLRLLARTDAMDSERGVVALQEMWVEWQSGPFRLRAGNRLLDWSSTEAFHPADIINSRNFDGNIENPEKLGEPMIELLSHWWGGASASAFYMPWRVPPHLLSGSSRSSFFVGKTVAPALWLDGDGGLSENSLANQFGFQINKSVNAADFSLHFVNHFDRSQPYFVADAGGTRHPIYLRVAQLGGTWRQAVGSFVLKLEAVYRTFQRAQATAAYGLLRIPAHAQIAAGIDYGVSSESGADSTLLLEAHTLLMLSKEQRDRIHPFPRDVLVGYRYACNDTMGTTLGGALIADLDRLGDVLFSVNFSRRLDDNWRVEGAAQVVEAVLRNGGVANGLTLLRGDDRISLQLLRSF